MQSPFSPRPVQQAKTCGQDGWFWPLARAAMTDSEAIIDRMAEDCRAIATMGEDGTRLVVAAELVGMGWPEKTIWRHGTSAIKRAFDATTDENDHPAGAGKAIADAANTLATVAGLAGFFWCITEIAGLADAAARLAALV